MEKYAWKAIVKEGCLEEYKKRHDEIWPEMLELLKQARNLNLLKYQKGTKVKHNGYKY